MNRNSAVPVAVLFWWMTWDISAKTVKLSYAFVPLEHKGKELLTTLPPPAFLWCS